MTALLIIALVCFMVGIVLMAVTVYQMDKATKRFVYEMNNVNERLYRLSEELHYILEQFHTR